MLAAVSLIASAKIGVDTKMMKAIAIITAVTLDIDGEVTYDDVRKALRNLATNLEN